MAFHRDRQQRISTSLFIFSRDYANKEPEPKAGVLSRGKAEFMTEKYQTEARDQLENLKYLARVERGDSIWSERYQRQFLIAHADDEVWAITNNVIIVSDLGDDDANHAVAYWMHYMFPPGGLQTVRFPYMNPGEGFASGCLLLASIKDDAGAYSDLARRHTTEDRSEISFMLSDQASDDREWWGSPPAFSIRWCRSRRDTQARVARAIEQCAMVWAEQLRADYFMPARPELPQILADMRELRRHIFPQKPDDQTIALSRRSR